MISLPLIVGLLASTAPSPAHVPLLHAPIWVYNNWSAYDELSDNVPLDETLAMRELSEVLRLRRAGVHFDYYMMDAFWFDPDAGYRQWRADRWPHGPDRWIAACLDNGIKPGLWFSTNTLSHLHVAPQWRSSLDKNDYAMSMYAGGFLPDFVDVLEYWYHRGIRMFKFDFADFNVAAKGDEKILTPHEIRQRNVQALHAALQSFRRRHPDAVLVGFNGIVGNIESARSPLTPFESRWLDVFDTLYSGDPRPSNVPEMDFWRSMDIYSDHMVRSFERGGIPLTRIDSTSFMLGDTGTNYHRRTSAWRGSLLLMLAHGGWINTVHGNLEFLDDADAQWVAKAQRLYAPLQRGGATTSFGGIPLNAQPYGFRSADKDSALYMIVNPAQSFSTIRLPVLRRHLGGGGRILFRDAGYVPVLEGGTIRLGPGQIALVGFGRYDSARYDLGIEADIRIPSNIEPVPAQFTALEHIGPASQPTLAIETIVMPPSSGDLRIIMQQRDSGGRTVRSVSEAPMGRLFTIAAQQRGRPLPMDIRYDKVVWSGLSWATGEIRHEQIAPGEPISIRLSAAESDASLHLDGRLYVVDYQDR